MHPLFRRNSAAWGYLFSNLLKEDGLMSVFAIDVLASLLDAPLVDLIGPSGALAIIVRCCFTRTLGGTIPDSTSQQTQTRFSVTIPLVIPNSRTLVLS